MGFNSGFKGSIDKFTYQVYVVTLQKHNVLFRGRKPTAIVCIYVPEDLPNIVITWVALVCRRIRKVLCSNSAHSLAILTGILRGLPKSLQANDETILQIRSFRVLLHT